ncbi:SpoIIE family protein phosphatase [Streptomyces sp. NPDC092296]|uniref:SpoIIE family protein phosphatase n=1 Tax=Streptomyces sp. NPDC092296 TaxID=3366012 RepID=UPI0037F2DA82
MPSAARPDHSAVLPDGVGGVGAGARAAAGAGLAEWDLLTDEVRWSPEVFALFGRERSAGALTLDQLPAYVLPDDQPLVQGMVTAALVDGRAPAGEFRVVRADGTVRGVRCAGEPVAGEDGHAVSLWMTLLDLGERRPAAGASPDRPEARRSEVRQSVAANPDVAVRPPAAPVASGAPAAWCDALPLPGGGLLLTVGSVAAAARGGAAEPAMVRDALRGMAMTGAGPARMLRLLDELLRHCGVGSPVSVLCCRYEPGEQPALVWARAGHRPALLYRGGVAQPSAADGCTGEPLGGGVSGARQQRVALRPGDVVLCWSGGPQAPADRAALDAVAARFVAAPDAAGCAESAVGALWPGGAGAVPGDGGLLALRVR